MKLLAILLVLAAVAWVFASCFRALPASGFWWRVAFGLLTFAGLVVGVYLVAWRYDESPSLKVTGFPFTIGAAEFHDGRWQSGLIARHHLLACLADFALALLVFLTPFRLAQWLCRSENACPSPR